MKLVPKLPAVVACFMVSAIFVLGPVAAAQADTVPDDPGIDQGQTDPSLEDDSTAPEDINYVADPDVTSQLGMVHFDHTTGISAQAASVNFSPAGCYGQTDYTHASKTSGLVSVHGRTHCSRGIPQSLGVTTYLQKKGATSWATKAEDGSYETGTNDSKDAHPHYKCSVGTWGGASFHWSYEGTYYNTSEYTAATLGHTYSVKSC